MTQETKLGIFVLIGLLGLVITTLTLGNFQFGSRYTLYVLFDDISGLQSKAKVKVSGVDVGAISNITLQGDKARVKIWVRKNVVIRRDARATVVSTGFVGTKYLELTPGSAGAPPLRAGDTIQGTSPVPFDKIVDKVMEKLDSLFGALEGPEGRAMGENLARTLANLRAVTDTLRAALDDQERKIAAVIDNFHSFSGDMAAITADNRDDLRTMVMDLKSAAEKMNAVLAQVQNGEGTVGMLLSDKELGENVKATVADLKETISQTKNVVRRLNLIETSWDYRLRYDNKYDARRHDVGLIIKPRPDKFYYIGASNVGEDGNSRISKDPEELNTLNLQIGKDFGPVLMYAGMIRSKGGVGGKLKPFWKWQPLSRLEFTAEGYNFFREKPVARPSVNAGARMQITSWGAVGVQVEDLYYASSTNLYANFTFRDDDIAYILGLVGLAKP